MLLASRPSTRRPGRATVFLGLATVALAVSTGPTAFAASITPITPTTPTTRTAAGADVTTPSCTDAPRGGRLDGFAINVLPNSVGEQVSDFSYEWEDVTFSSRVWEAGPDADGAYRVDASVKILRGERLTDLPELVDYLADYHERDPESWELTGFEHPDGAGYWGDGEAFWLAEPGVAVSVRVDSDRFSGADLLVTALGVRQLDR